jgi:molybdopterin molybdotransferase
MAQLSDDCFAFGRSMMPVDEAMRLITRRIAAVGETETVALVEADGRIVARDIVAPLPLPPFTNSAVDGFAVPGHDMPHDKERTFPVSGRVAAGSSVERVQSGHAVRIFTGAPDA